MNFDYASPIGDPNLWQYNLKHKYIEKKKFKKIEADIIKKLIDVRIDSKLNELFKRRNS